MIWYKFPYVRIFRNRKICVRFNLFLEKPTNNLKRTTSPLASLLTDTLQKKIDVLVNKSN